MKRVALLLLFFPILVCWGGDKPQAPLWQEKGGLISSNKVKHSDPFPELIHVSYFIVPPHVFLDKNKNIRGAIYDLINNYIAPEIGIKFQWDKLPTSICRQILNLKEGKNYISCFLVFSSERNKFMIFSKNPYYYAQPIIAVHKSNPIKEVRNVGDIDNMIFGYHPKGTITAFMMDPSIKFEFVEKPDF